MLRTQVLQLLLFKAVVTDLSYRSVPHVGQEMLTLSGTPDFTTFGELMISSIRYMYIIYITECVSLRAIHGLMTGLFARISLDCFVSDLLFYTVVIYTVAMDTVVV